MKWKRNEDRNGEYHLFNWDDRLAVITPKSEPGKRARCWELEKVVKVTPGLGSNGIITEYQLELIGVYPTLKQAKEAYK